MGGICKIISLTLHRYKDTASQSYIKDVLVALLQKYKESAVKHMSGVINELAIWHKNTVPS